MKSKKEIYLIAFFGAHYRYEILKKIDDTFNVKFFVGDVDTSNPDIKPFDYNLLKNCTTLKAIKIKFPLFYLKGLFNALKKDIKEYIIFMPPYAINLWPFLLFAKIMRKRLTLWTIGYTGRESLPVRIIKFIYFRMFDKIMVYGDHSKSIMQKKGINPDNVTVIKNSNAYYEQIKLRTTLSKNKIYKTHFGNSNYNLIFIGRLNPIKKLDMILQAMHILKEQNIHLNLTYIGSGSDKQRLENLSKKLNLEKNVWFYGACYNQEIMSNLVYNADLCVSPGNVGLTSILAMSFGCPVISHNNPNYQDPEFESIKPGITGDFFVKDNVKSLAQVIKNWLSTNNDKQKILNNCFTEIDKYWNPNYQIEKIQETI